MDTKFTNQWKKTAVSAAVAVALGASATASADTIDFSFTGLFTMLDPSGKVMQNTSYKYGYESGNRTRITGTMSFDTATGAGTGTLVPFQFFSGNSTLPATATGINMQAIGNGAGGAGTLVLGNMGFNWNGNNGIPVSIVLDAQGLFGAMNAAGAAGLSVGAVVNGTYGTTGATDPAMGGSIKMGNLAIATTTWNTTTIAGAGQYSNPSATTPLVVDPLNSPYGTGIGGNPMLSYAGAPFGGFNANFDIQSMTVTKITLGTDTTPDAFTFTSTIPLQNAVTSSNTVTITGIDTATPISIAGAASSQYSIDGGAWTSAPGTIKNNHTVQVRHTAASGGGVTTTTRLTVGTLTQTFSSTTAFVADLVPDAFSFTAQTGVAPSTVIESNSIQPTGYNSPTSISVSNGEYRINGGTYTSVTGTLNPGDTVQARHTSVGTFSSTDTTTLTIGGVAGAFSTTTVASDTTPDAFSFVSQSGVTLNTVVTSNPITVSGINDPSTPISVSGGLYSINGGAYTSSSGTVANGQTVTVQQTSANSNVAAVNTVLNIGGVSSTFTSTTKSASAVPFTAAFTMLDAKGANVGRDTAVTGTYDDTNINTTSTGTKFNMTLQSSVPFFGYPWTAHDIRVFGPGTYTINTDCTAAEIRANGGAVCASTGPALTFTVNAGQLGAHILFDWNGNNDIDVALVWNTDYSASAVPASAGIVYKFASQDGNGDGIAGYPMVAGPFTGFNANFDIKFSNYTVLTATQEGYAISGWKEVASATLASGMPASFTAGSGFVQFVVTLPPGQRTATIVLDAPNLKANDKAYWVDGSGVYHEIPGAVYDYTAKTVTYTVTDGGFGDADGTVDGVIHDPVGILTPVPQLASSSGAGGGGCTIGGSWFDPVLPGTLLAALFWLGWRRRKGE